MWPCSVRQSCDHVLFVSHLCLTTTPYLLLLRIFSSFLKFQVFHLFKSLLKFMKAHEMLRGNRLSSKRHRFPRSISCFWTFVQTNKGNGSHIVPLRRGATNLYMKQHFSKMDKNETNENPIVVSNRMVPLRRMEFLGVPKKSQLFEESTRER